MTTVALDAFPQYSTNGGLPLAGGKLYSYQAGTLIPLATYTDRGGLVANANPVVLDSAGRADIWLSVNVAYKLILEDSAGNVIDSVDDYYAGADPAQLTAAGIVPATGGTYTGLVEFEGGVEFNGDAAENLNTLDTLGIASVQNANLWINSDFALNTSNVTTAADGAVGFDKSIILAQSGSVTLNQVAQPADGVPYAMRLTQPDAGPKRIGVCSLVSATDTYAYRGKNLVLVPKVRASASTTIRCALVAWTGTADTAPNDVVNDWTSTNYTAGNFFIANTTTIAVTATAVVANTLTDILASSTSAGGVVAPSTMNNLYMVVWTDTTQAQNFTLDIATVRAGQGTRTPIWTPPNRYSELLKVNAPGFNNMAVYKLVAGVQNVSINGSAFATPGASAFIVSPTGRFRSRVWGAGGGSGGTNLGNSGSQGGAGGGYAEAVSSAAPGTSVTITVGAGGTAGVGGGGATNGGNGGASSAGAFASATGGNGGIAASGGIAAGTSTGGTGTTVGGGLTVQGASPNTAFNLGGGLIYSATGGAGAMGGGAVNGGAQTVSAAGAPGIFPGGGASGSINQANGAAGADGLVIIEY